MKITLSANIRKLRKERKMTQEQLAEAMGVTVGAVHKWETGASMPEIRLLPELAGLFSVSVDALLGYEMQNNAVDSVVERINGFLAVKDFASAAAEAEKALVRYPNTFRVVRCCGELFGREGIETGDHKALHRAMELMEHSVALLSQNDDPGISEVTIRSDIAVCHIMMGQTEKGIEMLKKYNAGGINNALLGSICSRQSGIDLTETESFLTKGMVGVVTNTVRCMSGYINYYNRCENLSAALDASDWLVRFADSLRADSKAVCYLDKICSSFQAVSASLLSILGRQEESDALLQEAYRRAAAFDAAPVYDAAAMRFVLGETEMLTASDDLGETAIGAIDKILHSDEHCRTVLERWEQLKATNPPSRAAGNSKEEKHE